MSAENIYDEQFEVDLARPELDAGFIESVGSVAVSDVQMPADDVIIARRPRTSRPQRSNSKRPTSGNLSEETAFLDQLVGVELLTKEDEFELGAAVQAGIAAQYKLDADDFSDTGIEELEQIVAAGEAAKKVFIESNLRLVISIARRYKKLHSELDDRIQFGMIGLIRAVEKFEPEKGFKFSTYGTFWIKQAITRGVAKTAHSMSSSVRDYESSVLLSDLQIRYADMAEPARSQAIAWEMGISIKKLQQLQIMCRTVVSLDKEINGDGKATQLIDLIADSTSNDGYEKAEASVLTQQILELAEEVLTLEERNVLLSRNGFFGEDHIPYDTIADSLGLTKGQVRLRYEQAIKKLQKAIQKRSRNGSA